MKANKILTGLAAVTVLIATLAMTVSAVEPSYKVSDDYKDTLYYNNLLATELTGDGATDVIAVALSQLGYHEGNGNADLDGQNTSGSKNFTEYNVLFGKLDNGEGNGTSYGYAWCAAFVNWCLRQARVDKELTGGMFVSCHAWRTWFVEKGAKYGAEYHARTDGYVPKKGDLIFYKSLTATHNRSSDHIGIVLESRDGRVYVIEGNGDNQVALHDYDLTNRYIVGYGSIAYKTADVPAVDYYATEGYFPGDYIAGKGKVTAYAGPASSTGKVASLTPSAVYRITAVQDSYGRVRLEDGSVGWVSLRRFTPMTTDAFYRITLEAGEQSVSAIVAQGESWTVPDLPLAEGSLGWSAGEGSEIYQAGQVITPASDLVLQAAYPQQSETEAETETKAEAEPESIGGETTELPVQSTEQESDAVQTEQSGDTGCNGVIGGAGIAALIVGLLLAMGAVFATGKKRD